MSVKGAETHFECHSFFMPFAVTFVRPGMDIASVRTLLYDDQRLVTGQPVHCSLPSCGRQTVPAQTLTI